MNLNIEQLKHALQNAEAVVVGAGAGLPTSAGFVYSGERFHKHFADFEAKYGFADMYSGGFYPLKRQRNFGRIGRDTSMSTAMPA